MTLNNEFKTPFILQKILQVFIFANNLTLNVLRVFTFANLAKILKLLDHLYSQKILLIGY